MTQALHTIIKQPWMCEEEYQAIVSFTEGLSRASLAAADLLAQHPELMEGGRTYNDHRLQHGLVNSRVFFQAWDEILKTQSREQIISMLRDVLNDGNEQIRRTQPFTIAFKHPDQYPAS